MQDVFKYLRRADSYIREAKEESQGHKQAVQAGGVTSSYGRYYDKDGKYIGKVVGDKWQPAKADDMLARMAGSEAGKATETESQPKTLDQFRQSADQSQMNRNVPGGPTADALASGDKAEVEKQLSRGRENVQSPTRKAQISRQADQMIAQDQAEREAAAAAAVETQAVEPEKEAAKTPAPEPITLDQALEKEDGRSMADIRSDFERFRERQRPRQKGAKGETKRAEFDKRDAPGSDDPEGYEKQAELAAKTPQGAEKNIQDLVRSYGITGALERQRKERQQRLNQKIKKGEGPVAQQEGNTLITFYNAIEKGKSLKDGGDMELFDMLNQNFPDMATAPPAVQKAWYQNFLEQGKSIRDYLGLGDDEVDTSYDYERVSGSGVNFVPKEKQHSIIADTWNKFTPAQKKFYGNKDDSWNPADISMVKTDQKEAITQEIDRILDEFKDMDPSLGPAVVNSYLKNLAKNKILIPISLKQGDIEKGANVGVKEYNYGDQGALTDDEGMPKAVQGSYRQGKSPKTEMGITSSGGQLGFDSNSLLFDPVFNMGGKEVQYRIENKPSSLNSDAFEIRELINGQNANARGGGVPAPVTAQMVKDVLGTDLNDRMGLGQKQGSTVPFTDDDVKYYSDMYRDLASDETYNMGKKGLAWNGKTMEPEDYFKRLFNMANTGSDEEMGQRAEAKFQKAVRSKLRHMKIMSAMKKKNEEGDLGTFLAKLYYNAGKVNLDDQMTKGPFVKVQ